LRSLGDPGGEVVGIVEDEPQDERGLSLRDTIVRHEKRGRGDSRHVLLLAGVCIGGEPGANANPILRDEAFGGGDVEREQANGVTRGEVLKLSGGGAHRREERIQPTRAKPPGRRFQAIVPDLREIFHREPIGTTPPSRPAAWRRDRTLLCEPYV